MFVHSISTAVAGNRPNRVETMGSQVIPAERLLIYNWSDGWTPLAHFVGLPVTWANHV